MESAEGDEVTPLLCEEAQSAQERADKLLPLVYQQLRAAAQQRMASEQSGHTLQATALVHEAYIRGSLPVCDCLGESKY